MYFQSNLFNCKQFNEFFAMRKNKGIFTLCAGFKCYKNYIMRTFKRGFYIMRTFES